ncbi:MAG: NifB/NifX family molybdenum-iron cluster-binding protein [Thermotogota bacterium]
MNITIGMKDDKSINEDHFGQSKFYNIFKYDYDKLTFLEKRDNPYFGVDKHAKVEDIKEVVGDCKIWVAKTMGKQSRLNLIETGFKPIIVKSNDIDDVLKEIKIYLLEAN